MSDGRNIDWNIRKNFDGSFPPHQAQLGVLVDIREELRKLNRLLSCPSFINIPGKLDAIRRKLPAQKPKAKK